MSAKYGIKIGTDEMFRKVDAKIIKNLSYVVICADCARDECHDCKWDTCEHIHYWRRSRAKTEAELFRDAGISLREGCTEAERTDAHMSLASRSGAQSPYDAGYR